MTQTQARNQSLTTAAAAVVFFIGLCHEAVGEALFPWGPPYFGGELPWHALGVLTIVLGAALVGGALRLFRFPVVAVGLALVPVGIGIAVLAWVTHHQSHLFALTVAAAGALMAYCHRKSA